MFMCKWVGVDAVWKARVPIVGELPSRTLRSCTIMDGATGSIKNTIQDIIHLTNL